MALGLIRVGRQISAATIETIALLAGANERLAPKEPPSPPLSRLANLQTADLRLLGRLPCSITIFCSRRSVMRLRDAKPSTWAPELGAKKHWPANNRYLVRLSFVRSFARLLACSLAGWLAGWLAL